MPATRARRPSLPSNWEHSRALTDVRRPGPPKDGISVLLFYSTECPISNAYSPTLNSLFDAFHAPAVKWSASASTPT